jgi:hypothetical protein
LQDDDREIQLRVEELRREGEAASEQADQVDRLLAKTASLGSWVSEAIGIYDAVIVDDDDANAKLAEATEHIVAAERYLSSAILALAGAKVRLQILAEERRARAEALEGGDASA